MEKPRNKYINIYSIHNVNMRANYFCIKKNLFCKNCWYDSANLIYCKQ